MDRNPTEVAEMCDAGVLTEPLNEGDEITVRYVSAHSDEPQTRSGVVSDSEKGVVMVRVFFSDGEDEYRLTTGNEVLGELEAVNYRTSYNVVTDAKEAARYYRRISERTVIGGAILAIEVSPAEETVRTNGGEPVAVTDDIYGIGDGDREHYKIPPRPEDSEPEPMTDGGEDAVLTEPLNEGDEITVRYASAYSDEIQEASGVVQSSTAGREAVGVRFSAEEADEREYHLTTGPGVLGKLETVDIRTVDTGHGHDLRIEDGRRRISEDRIGGVSPIKSIEVTPALVPEPEPMTDGGRKAILPLREGDTEPLADCENVPTATRVEEGVTEFYRLAGPDAESHILLTRDEIDRLARLADYLTSDNRMDENEDEPEDMTKNEERQRLMSDGGSDVGALQCTDCGETFPEPPEPSPGDESCPHCGGRFELADGGESDTAVLARLTEGDDVQFIAADSKGRVYARMKHGRVTNVTAEVGAADTVEVEPFRLDDLDTVKGLKATRFKLSQIGGEVHVRAVSDRRANTRLLGTTDGTLSDGSMGGGGGVLLTDGGTDELLRGEASPEDHLEAIHGLARDGLHAFAARLAADYDGLPDERRPRDPVGPSRRARVGDYDLLRATEEETYFLGADRSDMRMTEVGESYLFSAEELWSLAELAGYREAYPLESSDEPESSLPARPWREIPALEEGKEDTVYIDGEDPMNARRIGNELRFRRREDSTHLSITREEVRVLAELLGFAVYPGEDMEAGE